MSAAARLLLSAGKAKTVDSAIVFLLEDFVFSPLGAPSGVPLAVLLTPIPACAALSLPASEGRSACIFPASCSRTPEAFFLPLRPTRARVARRLKERLPVRAAGPRAGVVLFPAARSAAWPAGGRLQPKTSQQRYGPSTPAKRPCVRSRYRSSLVSTKASVEMETRAREDEK